MQKAAAGLLRSPAFAAEREWKRGWRSPADEDGRSSKEGNTSEESGHDCQPACSQ